jgi:hypothetical protein
LSADTKAKPTIASIEIVSTKVFSIKHLHA